MDITIANGVEFTEQQIRESAIFANWEKRLPAGHQWSVRILDIGWGGAIHMISMEVVHQGNPYPVKVTLRSETVDVLVRVVSPRSDHVVFVRQLREAVPGVVVSNVAGGIEGDEDPMEAARREVFEEIGLGDIPEEDYTLEIVPLLSMPLLASPGIINERVHFMMATIHVGVMKLHRFLEKLENKRTGVSAEGEDITLTVVATKDAERFVLGQRQPCAKTYLSLRAADLRA